MEMPEPKPAGTWDFYGACAPKETDLTVKLQEKFSLGCFQWEAYARGKGTKKGKVKYRITGNMCDPKPAFDAARAYCAKKNGEGK